MKNKNKEKVAFICFLAASICFYISGLIGVISKDGSNWVTNLCLGSALLCLATTHLNKSNDKKDE